MFHRGRRSFKICTLAADGPAFAAGVAGDGVGGARHLEGVGADGLGALRQKLRPLGEAGHGDVLRVGPLGGKGFTFDQIVIADLIGFGLLGKIQDNADENAEGNCDGKNDGGDDRKGLHPDLAAVPGTDHGGVGGPFAQTPAGEQQKAAIHGVDEQKEIPQHQGPAGDGLAGLPVHHAQTQDPLADASAAQQPVPAHKGCDVPDGGSDTHRKHQKRGHTQKIRDPNGAVGQQAAKGEVQNPGQNPPKPGGLVCKHGKYLQRFSFSIA